MVLSRGCYHPDVIDAREKMSRYTLTAEGKPRAFPSAGERAHAVRQSESAVSCAEREQIHPLPLESMLGAVQGDSHLTVLRASQGRGLIPGQQDSPKSNYGTRLASKDSAVIDVPSCTWSVGCAQPVEPLCRLQYSKRCKWNKEEERDR